MKKRVIALLLVTVLLATTTVSVLAETGTVVISSGTLSVTAADVTLSGITLNGSDQTATSAFSANSWTAQDSRGSGEGWNLTIVATDFTSGGNTLDISAVGTKFKIQLTDAHIVLVSGNTKPVSDVTTMTDIPESPAAALKFVHATAGTGMGAYTISPNFELEVPSTTVAGTYTSTITVTAVAGP